METLNGVSIVECWVWKVCLRLILIRETKKNIVRWVLSVGASRKVTHLTLSVWRFWISIRVWTRNWLSDIYSKGGWHRCVCVCVSYPHLLPLKMNLCRVGTLLLYPIIGWRYDTNIWLQRSMLGAKMESSWNRYIISRCNCLFWYKWSHTDNYLSPTRTPQNASTFSPKFFSCPDRSPTLSMFSTLSCPYPRNFTRSPRAYPPFLPMVYGYHIRLPLQSQRPWQGSLPWRREGQRDPWGF